ncbi:MULTISPECIES: hypothetical protein [Halorussus]|uniref:hypothetical protein n=1 Tax=Halorussus TaxID=1070314 RepID=UPI0013B3B2F7|nr:MULTISPECIES: hypothetical protein [Halorussus]NHN61351.1 hypothetical protein [Halorussus sp. JP-T4]
MDTAALGLVFGIVGLAVGLALGDAATATLGGIFGFFGGKVADSLSRTVAAE